VIRETGVGESQRASIVANERWTVSNKATSIHAACMGLGFAWFPEESIRSELDSGQLKVLPLLDGGERYAMVYLMFADPDSTGPSTLRFAELLQAAVKALRPENCRPSAN
jgi:DNA-binding transcriptional LysR family regulator